MIMQSEDLEDAANTLICAGARTDLIDPGPPPPVATGLDANTSQSVPPQAMMSQSVEIGGSPAGNCIIS